MCACHTISSYNKRGMEALNQGRIDEALKELNEAIWIAGILGAKVLEAKIQNNLALVYQASGRLPEARRQLCDALNKVEVKIGRENRLYASILRNMDALAPTAA